MFEFRSKKHSNFFLFIIGFLMFGVMSVSAQVTSSSAVADPTNPDLTKTREAAKEILVKSGVYFKEGMMAFADSNRGLAGQRFNDAVEVFLFSSINVQRDTKLKGCYDQLIETIYRIEFPFGTQNPQLPALASACEWKFDDQLTERVTKSITQTANREYSLTDGEAKLILEKENAARSRLGISRTRTCFHVFTTCSTNWVCHVC